MQRKRGEIATFLALAALGVMMVGILVGSSTRLRSLFGRAATSLVTENEEVTITWEPAPVPAQTTFVSYRNWILKGNICFKKTPATGRYSLDALSGATGKTEFGITVPFQAKCGTRGINFNLPTLQSACPVSISLTKLSGNSVGGGIEVPYFSNPQDNPRCAGFIPPTAGPTIPPTAGPTPTPVRFIPLPTGIRITIPPRISAPPVNPTLFTSSCKYSARVKVTEYINTITSADPHHKPKFAITKFYAPDKWGFSNSKQSYDKPATRFGQNGEYKVGTDNLKFPYGGYTEQDRKKGLGYKLFYDKDEYRLSDYNIEICSNQTGTKKCVELDKLYDADGDPSTVDRLPIDCNIDVTVEYLLELNPTCPLNASAKVYKDKKGGALVSQGEFGASSWGISNDKQDQTKPARQFSSNASYSVNETYAKFRPDNPEAQYFKNEISAIKLFSDWEIVSKFCDGKGCPDYDVNTVSTSDKITGIKMSCNTNVNYGWVVKKRQDRTYQLNIAKKDRPANSPDNICAASAANTLDKTFASSGDNLGKNEDYGCSAEVLKIGKDIKELSASYVNRGENPVEVIWGANICDGTVKDNQTGNPKCDTYRGGGSPTWTLKKNESLKCSWKNPYPSIPNLNSITDNCVKEEAPDYLSKPKGTEPAAYSLMVYKGGNSLQNCFAASRADGTDQNIVGNVEFSNYGTHDCRAYVEGSGTNIQYTVEYTNNESTPQTIVWQTNSCVEGQIQRKDGKLICTNLIGGGKGQSAGKSGNPFNTIRNWLFGRSSGAPNKASPQAIENSSKTLKQGETYKVFWTCPSCTWSEPRCDDKVCHARPANVISKTPTKRPVCEGSPPPSGGQPPNPDGSCQAGTCPQEGKCWSGEEYETGQDCPANQSKKVRRSIVSGQCKYDQIRECRNECERPTGDGGKGGICEGSMSQCNGGGMQYIGQHGCPANQRFCCAKSGGLRIQSISSPQSCKNPVSDCRAEGGLCRDRSEGCPNAYSNTTTTGCGQSDIPLICCKPGKKPTPTPKCFNPTPRAKGQQIQSLNSPSQDEPPYCPTGTIVTVDVTVKGKPDLYRKSRVGVTLINPEEEYGGIDHKRLSEESPIKSGKYRVYLYTDKYKDLDFYSVSAQGYYDSSGFKYEAGEYLPGARKPLKITNKITSCPPYEDVSQDGNKCRTIKGSTVQFEIDFKDPELEPTPTLPPGGGPINKNVFLLIFNPIMVKPDGTNLKLSEYLGWNNPQILADDFVYWFNNKTEGKISYKIVDRKEVDQYPAKEDGYVYNDYPYIQECIPTEGKCAAGDKEGCKCHRPSTADYEKIEKEFGICKAYNDKKIDEVWLFGAPEFGFYESRLIGKGGYDLNSGPVQILDCDGPVPVMGFNYERGIDEMIHDFGHRIEATLNRLYGGWNFIYEGGAEGTNISVPSTNWDKFAQVLSDANGCGNTHYPFNADEAYDYDSDNEKNSYCDSFLNYPNIPDSVLLKDSIKALNCNAWGCGEQRYYWYWFQHIPSRSGVGPDGKLNDWWQYIMNPDLANY